MKTFDNPQRQSPFALVIMFFYIFRVVIGQVWPAMIALFFGKKENMGLKWLIIGGGFILFVLIKTLLDYWFMTFSIQQGQLVIRKGVFTKKIITIPLERIQAVHLEQSLLHTLTQTYKLIIDTAGTDEEEIKIYAIAAAKATDLRYILLNNIQDTDIHQAVNRVSQNNYKLISRLGIGKLMKLSLSANHLETMALLFLFAIGKYEDIKPLINKIPLLKQLQTYSDTVQFTWTVVASLVILTLLLTMLFSIIRTFIRFYDYTVRMDGKGFHIRWGLIQIRQKMVPFNKIQIISWKSNLIRRLIGLSLLNLKVTGQLDNKTKLRLEIPATSEEQVNSIVHAYQPLLPSAGQITGNKIHAAYIIHRVFFIVLPFLLLVSVLLLLQWGSNGLWVLLWWPFSIGKNWWYCYNFRYWVSETGLQKYTGTFGKNEMLLNWKHVQYVQLRQTLYQKRKGLATLILHTAGGRFDLPFISYADGLYLSNYALYKTESSQQNWM